ncbi:hypothetical protein A9165_07795 [Alishewanella sp. HH-ZS]|nr:hypothetical protein A9165_07795 [Alishewanella sp. HH-ZS]
MCYSLVVFNARFAGIFLLYLIGMCSEEIGKAKLPGKGFVIQISQQFTIALIFQIAGLGSGMA